MSKILTEIRRTRDALAREAGYDLRRLFEMVREREREAAARGVKFVSPSPHEKETNYVLREKPPRQKP